MNFIIKIVFNIIYFIAIPLLIGIIAVLWHKSAYAGSDIQLWVVFIFWTIKALIILGTGFCLFGVIIHMSNNFFIDFGRLYASDFVLYVAFGIIIGLVVLYTIIYRKRLWGSTRQEEVVFS